MPFMRHATKVGKEVAKEVFTRELEAKRRGEPSPFFMKFKPKGGRVKKRKGKKRA